MKSIASHIAEIRRKVSPRTSYATSGIAASEILLFDPFPSTVQTSYYEVLSTELIATQEFQQVTICESIEKVNTHVVIFHITNTSNKEMITFHIHQLFESGKSRLCFVISLKDVNIESIVTSLQLSINNSIISSKLFIDYMLTDIYISALDHKNSSRISSINHHGNSTTTTTESFMEIAFNGQVSVQSRRQFQYIWNLSQSFNQNGISSTSGSTITSTSFSSLHQNKGDGKLRVLQRLASKNVIKKQNNNSNDNSNSNNNSNDVKMSVNDWESLITDLLSKGKNDWDIYSTIRLCTLGNTLEESLQLEPLTSISNPSTGGIDVNNSNSNNNHSNHDGGDNEEGRSNFMMKMVIDCIPKHLISSGKIRNMLDYGCAEGSITGLIGSTLLLPPSNIFGADIRYIPSSGFTFIHLKSEEQYITEGSFRMFPTISDGSIDIIIASMVFHHVTNIYHVLQELRRILSPHGCLVLREHLCDSSEMAAFLDITHGLYSLAWSQPVEWPHFLTEYKAYYRNRDEWTTLLQSCGFKLYDPQLCSPNAYNLCYSVDQKKMKKDGTITNVIKAYYATYVSDPKYIPKILSMPKLQSIVRTSIIQDSGSGRDSNINNKKRSIEDSIDSDNTDNRNIMVSNINLEEKELWESKKYPGMYYYINSTDHSPRWVTIEESSNRCIDSISGIQYKISKKNKKS